ncbi:SUKH-4 family immunity protein, partial [Streptomyces sp. 12297]
MVTFAQAQERAEEWVNGDVPAYQHREVRVREFGLGFVVWAEDRANGPVSGGGRQRLVIARDSGEVTLWPGLPVGEVIRRYEEEYGAEPVTGGDSSVPPPRIDSDQTSFMLSPPEWLQEAADRAGIPDHRPAAAPEPVPPVPSASPAAAPAYEPTASEGVPSGHTPWAGTDTNPEAGSDEGSVPLPATVFAPPLSGVDIEDTPGSGVAPEAKTTLMAGGSRLPKTAISPALSGLGPADIADDTTSRAEVRGPAAPAGIV